VTELMKNQFYDTVNCNPLEVVCFKQIKSCLSTEKPYAICSVATVYTSWAESALGLFYF